MNGTVTATVAPETMLMIATESAKETIIRQGTRELILAIGPRPPKCSSREWLQPGADMTLTMSGDASTIE
jgi:hypothetical protein